MLGQSTNGEFALGQIEDTTQGFTDGEARFTAAQTARVVVGIGLAGSALFGSEQVAYVDVEFSTTAVVNVEIS
jgi:hypothetical protein